MRQVSPNMVEAITAPETAEVFLYILEISHTALAIPIRIVNNYENIVSNGNTYLGAAFSFVPPAMDNGTMSPAKLNIDNVDRIITEAVRSINTAATLTMSVIMASDPDTLELGPIEMEIYDVQYTKESVSASIYKNMHLDVAISKFIMDNQNFPGLGEWI